MADSVKTSLFTPGSFVLGGEANMWRSRDEIILKAGQGVLKAGTVLGRITGNNKWIASPEASVSGEEGAEAAAGILWANVDTTNGDVKATAITRDCEVIEAQLYYDGSVDTSGQIAKKTQLQALGIILRKSS